MLRPACPNPRRFLGVASLFAACLGPLGAQPTHHIATGYTLLQAEQGAALPTGLGLTLFHVEPTLVEEEHVHRPNPADADFAGRVFTFVPAEGGTVSGHATMTGRFFYGRTQSYLPGVVDVIAPQAEFWLTDYGLRTLTLQLPAPDPSDVHSHSWIGEVTAEDDPALFPDILARLDYVIDRDGPTVVVGLNNGQTSPVPPLLAPAYHVISVGRTDGNHGAGFTTSEGSGRTKPDLVAPAGVTSNSTPMVASAAALLRATARTRSDLAAAEDPRVIKALLLAGATKEEFPAWSRTSTQPLDLRFGAGELNLHLSHGALTNGRQPASASTLRSARGWDRHVTLPGTMARLYFFEIPTGNTANRFSAALTWHRVLLPSPTVVGDTPRLAWTSSLADLSLRLHAVAPGSFTLGALVDASTSPVDNVEHLFAPALAPGRYALAVESNTAGIPFGLAWRSLPTVTAAVATHGAKSPASPIRFTLTRSGGDLNAPLTVSYLLSGSAVNSVDYTAPAPAGQVVFAAGSASVTLVLTPTGAAPIDEEDNVTLSLAPHFPYALGAAETTSATARLFGTGYPAWVAHHFSAAEVDAGTLTGQTADPEGDGAPNLLEYTLGGSPHLADAPAILPTAQLSADHLTLTWHRPATAGAVTVIPEWSADLVVWSSSADDVLLLAPTPTATGTTHTARTTRTFSAAPAQFLRLRVTSP